MKTNEINRFLAEKIGTLDLDVAMNGYVIPNKDTGINTYFDPCNDIAHAFMVQAEIAKMGEDIKNEYCYRLEIISNANLFPNGYDYDGDGMILLINATAAQRSEAAVRTLGTADEIERLL